MIVKKIKNRTLVILLLTAMFLYSCGASPGVVFLDMKKQAIVSCSGGPINNIRIETPNNYITFEANKKDISVIYLNRINLDFKITMDNNEKISSNYEFKLTPNFPYTAISYNGYDRGPFKLTFTTDSLGRVISASNTECK